MRAILTTWAHSSGVYTGVFFAFFQFLSEWNRIPCKNVWAQSKRDQ